MTGSLLGAEPLVFVAAIVSYAIASAMVLWGVLMRVPRVERLSRVFAWAGLGIQAAAMLVRWYAVGHGPYLTRYEVLGANAFVTMALFLVVTTARPRLRPLGVVVAPAVLLLCALALYTGPEVRHLPPTFTGVWLVLHVLFYFVAFGTALTAVASGMLHVVRERGGLAQVGLSEPDELDGISHRFAGVAFAFWVWAS